MRSLMLARPQFGVTIMLVLLTIAGCSAPAKSTGSEHRTGGIALDLLVERDGDSRSLYRVFPDGTLGYAGGPDARARRITWTGRMTDEQIERLITLLERHNWLEEEPPPGVNGKTVRFRLDLHGMNGRQRYHVDGESEAVMPVYNHLREIALQRFEHIIETLPRPSAESSTP